MPAGNYFYKKIIGPQNLLDDEWHQIVLPLNPSVVNGILKKKHANLEFYKIDEQGNPLVRAHFEVYTKDGQLVKRNQQANTNNHGLGFVENLPPGEYYYVEKRAPQGYEVLEGKFAFTMPDISKRITVINKKKLGSIEFEKLDEKDKKTKLDGAIFEVYRTDKKGQLSDLVGTATTVNGVAIVKDLEPRTYYYKEVQAPNGYEENKEAMKFEITLNNLDVKKTVYNKKKKVGSIQFLKVERQEITKTY